MRRDVLKQGYDQQSMAIGSFGHLVTANIPGIITVIFLIAGLVASIHQGNQPIDLQTSFNWTFFHTTIVVIFAGIGGYVMGLPVQWNRQYNATWGNLLAIEEDADGWSINAILFTGAPRLSYAAGISRGYYQGNALDGHLVKATMMARSTPDILPDGLASSTMDDMWLLEPASGTCSDTAGADYENYCNRMQDWAERRTRKSQSWWARHGFETGYYVVLAILAVLIFLQASSLSAGAGFDPASVDPGNVPGIQLITGPGQGPEGG